MLVWNARHKSLLTDGEELGGSTTSTQSAAIVAVPGSDSLFYIFCICPAANTFTYDPTLYYSIIDVTADNGKGRLLARKVKLIEGVTERVIVARGTGAYSYWVIAASDEQDWFAVWGLSSRGLSAPRIYHAGGNPYLPAIYDCRPAGACWRLSVSLPSRACRCSHSIPRRVRYAF